jgi:hypothetical protein
MLELSSLGNEKLGGDGFSMATRAESKAISSTGSDVAKLERE